MTAKAKPTDAPVVSEQDQHDAPGFQRLDALTVKVIYPDGGISTLCFADEASADSYSNTSWEA